MVKKGDGDVFDGRWILGELKGQGFVGQHMFLHIQERRGTIFEGVSQEAYFQIFGLQGGGGIELFLGLIGQGEFGGRGDGGPSPEGEGRAVIGFG